MHDYMNITLHGNMYIIKGHTVHVCSLGGAVFIVWLTLSSSAYLYTCASRKAICLWFSLSSFDPAFLVLANNDGSNDSIGTPFVLNKRFALSSSVLYNQQIGNR